MRKLVHLITESQIFRHVWPCHSSLANEKKKGDRAEEKEREGERERNQLGMKEGSQGEENNRSSEELAPPNNTEKKHHPSFFSIGTQAVVLTNLELISFLSLRPVLTVSWRRISRLSLIRRLHSRFPFFLS